MNRGACLPSPSVSCSFSCRHQRTELTHTLLGDRAGVSSGEFWVWGGVGGWGGDEPQGSGTPILHHGTRDHSEPLRGQDALFHIPSLQNRTVQLRQMFLSRSDRIPQDFGVPLLPLFPGSAPHLFFIRGLLFSGKRIMHANAIPCRACN